MSVKPEQFHRRSFVYPQLAAAGAEFVDVDGAAVAARFPAPTPPLALTDLCPLPRAGVKGRRALTWLHEAGWPVPEANNTAVRHPEGPLVARLADSEAVILSASDSAHEAVRKLANAIPGAGTWSVPRNSTNCWFRLHGENTVTCLQKLCGVDLRAHVFPPGSVAQTSIARINGILIRDLDDDSAFHVLADSASAAWFWDVLLDAMQEFDGGPAGIHE